METPYFTVVVREGHALVPRDDVVVDRQDGQVSALNADTGRRLWSFQPPPVCFQGLCNFFLVKHRLQNMLKTRVYEYMNSR